jgi:zinc transporter ZupT
MEHVAYALIAGAGFTIAGVVGLFGIRVSNTLRLVSVAVAAGILLAISFADLLPEAYDHATRTSHASFAFAFGFLLLFGVETVMKTHTHHHDPHDGHDHSHDHLAAHHAVLPFCLGLGLHNLADGLAIGASAELSTTAAAGETLGILVHQLPVGLSFAAVLLAIAGPEWLERPRLLPALAVSYATLVSPFLIMQPAMGAGIASSRTPRPNAARLRSVVTHTVYGVGLYLAGWIWAIVSAAE